MKGISAVLATVLIVVITVAIIGMAYGWSTGMFKMVADTSEQNVQGVTDNMLKSVQIIAANCDSYGIITFTLKATGSKDILASELTGFVNNNMNQIQSLSGPFTVLSSGSSAELITSGTISGQNTLKINAPAGSVEKDVTCP